MAGSGFLDPQIKNNPSKGWNLPSPLPWQSSSHSSEKTQEGLRKPPWKWRGQRQSDLKIESWSIYFLYILGLTLGFFWLKTQILNLWGPCVLAIPLQGTKEKWIFFFPGCHNLFAGSLFYCSVKDSVLKVSWFRAKPKSLFPNMRCDPFCSSWYWRDLQKLFFIKIQCRRKQEIQMQSLK